MLHDPIGHREVGRRVVQLDVAGEGCLSGEDDRCGEHSEDGHRRGERPEIKPMASERPQKQPGHGEPGREGRRQFRCRACQRREFTGQDDQRETEREHERTWNTSARRRSTKRPQPKESADRASGKTIQATRRARI